LVMLADQVTCPVPGLADQAPFFGRLWLTVPIRVRLAIYRFIWSVWNKLTPRTSFYPRVRRIFPGLYLKHGTINPAEAHAMILLGRQTALPLSTALDYIEHKIPSTFGAFETFDFGYLLMTAVPGKTLREVEQTLTPEQILRIGLDLKDYISVVRCVPNPYHAAVCSASGGRLDVPLFGQDFIPSFDDTSFFHAWVWKNMRSHWTTMRSRLEPIFSRYDEEKTLFTHGDLSADNIMIKNGRFSGLIDWETAGWLPPYWEYTAARWRHDDVCRAIIKTAVQGYDKERRGMRIAASITRGSEPDGDIDFDYVD